jgi:hypothetical protein
VGSYLYKTWKDEEEEKYLEARDHYYNFWWAEVAEPLTFLEQLQDISCECTLTVGYHKNVSIRAMTLVSCCRRTFLRSRAFSAPKSLVGTCRNTSLRSTVQQRSFTKTPRWAESVDEKADNDANGTFWDEYRSSCRYNLS